MESPEFFIQFQSTVVSSRMRPFSDLPQSVIEAAERTGCADDMMAPLEGRAEIVTKLNSSDAQK
jgi:hypothetical protein